jgi:hypothetical protein
MLCRVGFCRFSCKTHQEHCNFQPPYTDPSIHAHSCDSDDDDSVDSKQRVKKLPDEKEDEATSEGDDSSNEEEEKVSLSKAGMISELSVVEYENYLILTSAANPITDTIDPDAMRLLMRLNGHLLTSDPLIPSVLLSRASENGPAVKKRKAEDKFVCSCPMKFPCHCEPRVHFAFFTCTDVADHCVCILGAKAKLSIADRTKWHAYLKQHALSASNTIRTEDIKRSPKIMEELDRQLDLTNPCFKVRCPHCGTPNGLVCDRVAKGKHPVHFMESVNDTRKVTMQLRVLHTYPIRVHVNPLRFDNAFAVCTYSECRKLIVLNHADVFYGLTFNTLCVQHREQTDKPKKAQIAVFERKRCALFNTIDVNNMNSHILPDPCVQRVCCGPKGCGLEFDNTVKRKMIRSQPELNHARNKNTCDKGHPLLTVESQCPSLQTDDSKNQCRPCAAVKGSIIGKFCGVTSIYDGFREKHFQFKCTNLSQDERGKVVLEWFREDDDDKWVKVPKAMDTPMYYCMRCAKHKQIKRMFCYGCLFRHCMEYHFSIQRRFVV